MKPVRIIYAGEFKEAFFRAANAEYTKRINVYCRHIETAITEAPVKSGSPGEIAACLEREGTAFLRTFDPRSYSVALCIEGNPMTSENFAKLFAEVDSDPSRTGVDFFIGGAYGMSDAVKSKCALRLSLSAMTLPHQLARVMLNEQIYRAMTRLNNAKYHK